MVGIGLGWLILNGIARSGTPFGGATDPGAGASASALAVGSSAPDFELESLSGERVRLSDLRGHPVLINFWATWCAPCELEMPTIESRYEQYSPDLVVLAVNFDEPVGDVWAFVDRLGLTFDVLLDPGAEVQDLYRIYGYPTTFFVDAQGVIRAQHVGVLTEKQLDGYLAQIGVGE